MILVQVKILAAESGVCEQAADKEMIFSTSDIMWSIIVAMRGINK